MGLGGDGNSSSLESIRPAWLMLRSRSFFFQIPLLMVGMANVYFTLPPLAPETQGWCEKLRRVDFGGAASIITAFSTLLVGLDHGSNYSWTSKITLWCMITSILSFQAFIYIEFQIAAEPFLPKSILSDRTLLACSLTNFFAYSAHLPLTYYLPLYWQATLDLTATQAALRLLPGIAAGVIGSLISGWVS